MDLHQIENILAIEREQSISRAAEKLFLTQSALNQQLLRLERELGTPLFERRRHVMVPTVAGRVYLNTARRMIDMKKETYKIIHDIAQEQAGEISVAYSPERGSLMFSNIYPVFHKRYPRVSFQIHEAHVKKMESLLLSGEATLACLTYCDGIKHPDIEYVDTRQELIVLALPESHPLAYLAGERSWDRFPKIDLKLLRDENFAMVSRTTKMREMVEEAFRLSGYEPKILFESASTRTVVNMVKQQVCPAFFPQSYVEPDAPMVYFSAEPSQSWTQCVAYLKGGYLTKPEKYFIELVGEYARGWEGEK